MGDRKYTAQLNQFMRRYAGQIVDTELVHFERGLSSGPAGSYSDGTTPASTNDRSTRCPRCKGDAGGRLGVCLDCADELSRLEPPKPHPWFKRVTRMDGREAVEYVGPPGGVA